MTWLHPVLASWDRWAGIGRPSTNDLLEWYGGFSLRHLISGAAGFIGSHLCDRLLADGHQVVGLDNLITGSRRNIEHLFGHPSFKFVEFDATLPITVSGDFQQVWHLASLASPKNYLAHPLETLESGSTATRNMLEVAQRDGARFLVTSTSECYGDPLEHPQVET